MVGQNLTKIVNDPTDKEARTNIGVCGGYSGGLQHGTRQRDLSPHSRSRRLAACYHTSPIGATLIAVAEAYYTKVCSLLPTSFDELGELLGEKRDPAKPGYAL